MSLKHNIGIAMILAPFIAIMFLYLIFMIQDFGLKHTLVIISIVFLIAGLIGGGIFLAKS